MASASFRLSSVLPVVIDLQHPLVGSTFAELAPGALGELPVAASHPIELCFLQLFQVEQCKVRAFDRTNQFIEFHLGRLRVAVLRALNQEHTAGR